MSHTPRLTIDELIAYLKRTSLPTLLVEGTDDVQIYRWLEEQLIDLQIDVLQTGGRTALMSIFDRRSEFTGNSPIAFVADQDAYIYDSIPADLSAIVWTNGYSIENDIYSPNIETLHRLLDNAELERVRKMIAAIIEWHAFEVDRLRSGKDYCLGNHINEVLDPNGDLKPAFLALRNYIKPSDSTVDELTTHYDIKLRGKTILEIYTHVLNDRSRITKWPKKNIIQLLLRCPKENPNLENLINSIRDAIAG